MFTVDDPDTEACAVVGRDDVESDVVRAVTCLLFVGDRGGN